MFNGVKPDSYTLEENEINIESVPLIPTVAELKMLDPNLAFASMNPIMFIKFKTALKEIFEKRGLNPDYIVRCNSSTFINFKRLPWVLEYLPKEKCLAGPFGDRFNFYSNKQEIFCKGTVMIATSDVARRFMNEEITDPMPNYLNDDVSISYFISKYATLYDLSYFFKYFEYGSVTDLENGLVIDGSKVFCRIKSVGEKRNDLDYVIWLHIHDSVDKQT
jgi:hypothetical protein